MASALSPHSSQFSEKDVSGVETPVTTLYSPPTSRSSKPRFTPGSGQFTSNNENSSGNVMSPLGSPPAGMRPEFYAQDFTAADPGQLAVEIEGAQAGDPHGTTAAYRHLVKTLVKRLGANPNTLAVKTSEKRQVERALDNARLEVEAQQNTIAHLKAELTERREHERLNQHSIALMDAKMNEKVRESLFSSNELDALRRHNQCLVDTKTGLESQLETAHARLVERSSYVVELEAKVEDIAAKLQDERRARQEEASAAAAEHGADQSHVADLTAQVDAMRQALSSTQNQLEDWGNADPKVAVSAELHALVTAAQEEAAAATAQARAAEARANAATAKTSVKPTMEALLLLAVAAWPILIAGLVYLAHAAYGNAEPSTATRAFAAVAADAEMEAAAQVAKAAAEVAASASAAAAAEFEAAFASAADSGVL